MNGNKKLNVLDIFSGIGGFSLGLENTGGFKTIAFCEKDIACRKVLKKHWPTIPIFNDILNLYNLSQGLIDIFSDIKVSEKIDVVCGGFPCQSVSVAGKKEGFNDREKSGLWYEYKRIIKEVKPRWVIIENVRNLLNIGFAEVIKDLYTLGYDAEWEIISARAIGANHKRERLWIVAYPSGQRRSKKSRGPYENETQNGEKHNYLSSSNVKSDSARKVYRDVSQTTFPKGIRLQGMWPSGEQELQSFCEEKIFRGDTQDTPDPNMPRFWPTFATEEEKQEWWAKATFSFRDWWQIESEFCRVDDGLSSRLDKYRRDRIKQLGNSIVPSISELIGRRMLYIEERQRALNEI